MIELNLAGLDEVRARFAQFVPETQAKVLRGLAQVAFDTAQRQVDTHTQTGALARSLRLQDDGDGGDGGWIISHDQQHALYAPFVHWGTRPHEIRPRGKKVLRWPSGKTGFIFARFVRHPGYEGDPWLVTAADEAVRQFDAIVRRATA